MSRRRVLIACKVFQDELTAVLSENANCDVLWIDAGLHANLDELETALTAELTKVAGTGVDVKLLFGSGCHPEICRLARPS